MVKEESSNFGLPYDVDLKIFEKALEILQMEKEGLSTTELFNKIDSKHASLKSTALKMCKFLGLADVVGSKVSLSSLGTKYFLTPLNERKSFLGKNIPSQYKTLLLWIKSKTGGMSLSELAISAVDAWGKPPNDKTFKSMLNSFARFGDYTGIIKYARGGIGRCFITDLGKEVLFGQQGSEMAPQSIRQIQEVVPLDRGAIINESAIVSTSGNVIRVLSRINGKEQQPLEIDVEIEEDFAIDSSGFSTSVFGRWFDYKYDEEKESRIYRKAHVMIGVKTNVVTSVQITKQSGEGSADINHYKPLLHKTAINFKVKEVSADMAYLSRTNLEETVQLGAMPFIPFKSNVTGGGNGLVWRKLWLYFKEQQQDYHEHYHKRSNVETTFSMIKRKFGSNLMTKKYVANVNEILCKIICHNLCCLISAYYEFGIEKSFCTKAYENQKLSIKV